MFFKAFVDRLVRRDPAVQERPAAAAAIEAVRAQAPAAEAYVAPPPRFSASTRADTYAIGPHSTAHEPALRRPANDDAVLTDAAADWVLELPAALRPEWTVLHFPRIVNRLERCWRDPELLDALFDDLLHERRGPRAAALPPHVHDELVRLARHRRRAAAGEAVPALSDSTIDILL